MSNQREVPSGAQRSPHDLEILGSLRRIIHAFDVQSRHLAATADVTLPQLLCLFAVVEEEPVVARDISRRIHVGTSTLVGVLDRLEAKGLVKRVRDSGDRRRVLIASTRAGRRLVAKAPSPMGEAFDESFAQLARSEQRRLAQCLARIADLMQTRYLPPPP